MTNNFHKGAAAVALAFTAQAGSAAVLTFDDIADPGPTFFTSPYHGFTFGTNDPKTNDWFYTNEASPFFLSHSGTGYVSVDNTNYARDGSFQPTQAISNTTSFTFDGAWFSDDPAFAVPDQISYQLYNGASLVYTSNSPSAALGLTPQFVASGYSGLVTSVVITGQQGFYAMDDFTYNTVAAVPEPETYALMIAGLLAIGAVRRRRSR